MWNAGARRRRRCRSGLRATDGIQLFPSARQWVYRSPPLTATAIPVVPPTSTPASAPPDQSQTKKIGLIVAAAVVVLAVIGGVVYFVSSGSSADATPTSLGGAAAATLQSRGYAQLCAYSVPSQRSACEAGIAANPSINSYSFRNISVGKVTQSGNKAVVWLTGQICKSGRCDSLPTGNTSGQSFATVYNNAVNVNSRSTLALALLEQGGKWYWVPVAGPSSGNTGNGNTGNTGQTGNTGKTGSTGSTGTSGNTGLGTSGSTGTSGNT